MADGTKLDQQPAESSEFEEAKREKLIEADRTSMPDATDSTQDSNDKLVSKNTPSEESPSAGASQQTEEKSSLWEKSKTVIRGIFAPTHMQIIGLATATGFLIAASVASAGAVPIALGAVGVAMTIGFGIHAVVRDVSKMRRRDKLADSIKAEEEHAKGLEGHSKDREKKLENFRGKLSKEVGVEKDSTIAGVHMAAKHTQEEAAIRQSLEGKEKHSGGLYHIKPFSPVRSFFKAVRDYLLKPLIEMPTALARLDIPGAVATGIQGGIEFISAVAHRREYTHDKNERKEQVNKLRIGNETVMRHREGRVGIIDGTEVKTVHQLAGEKVDRKMAKIGEESTLSPEEKQAKMEKYKEKYGVDFTDDSTKHLNRRLVEEQVRANVKEERAEIETDRKRHQERLDEVHHPDKDTISAAKRYAKDAWKVIKQGSPLTADKELDHHPKNTPNVSSGRGQDNNHTHGH